jgi:hypothetical protein
MKIKPMRAVFWIENREFITSEKLARGEERRKFMQEDMERRTVALSVNASKLTGRVLARVFAAAMGKI